MANINIKGMEISELRDMLEKHGVSPNVKIELMDSGEVKAIDTKEWDGMHREWDLRHDVTFLLGFIAGNSIEDDMKTYMFRLRCGLKSDFALGSVPDIKTYFPDGGVIE